MIVVTQSTGQATNSQHAPVRPEVQSSGPASQTFPSAGGRSEVQPPDPTGQTVTAKKSRFPLSLTGTAHPEEQGSNDDDFSEHTSCSCHMEEEGEVSDQESVRPEPDDSVQDCEVRSFMG